MPRIPCIIIYETICLLACHVSIIQHQRTVNVLLDYFNINLKYQREFKKYDECVCLCDVGCQKYGNIKEEIWLNITILIKTSDFFIRIMRNTISCPVRNVIGWRILSKQWSEQTAALLWTFLSLRSQKRLLFCQKWFETAAKAFILSSLMSAAVTGEWCRSDSFSSYGCFFSSWQTNMYHYKYHWAPDHIRFTLSDISQRHVIFLTFGCSQTL